MTADTTEENRMRTLANTLVLVAFLGLFAVGCNPASESVPDSRDVDMEAIRQADLAWSAAQASDGLDGTMSFYLDDAILLPPNRPMAIGKEAIREASAPIALPGFSVTWQPMKIGVARSGDIGYAIGTFEGTCVASAGNPMPVKGKYVEIWNKQADGSWKVAADMFSSDSPTELGF